MRIQFPFSQIEDKICDKPQDMKEYAQQQMGLVREKLFNMPAYSCAPDCNDCCHGTILMSFVEYVNIIAHMENWHEKSRYEFFKSRLGILEEEGKLLCPFVNDDREKEHCSIYGERPLICRVFGTSAAPCDSDIPHPHYPDRLFYEAYDHLYYMDGSFIGLPLTDTLVLYEAPFDVWAIADSGHTEDLLAIMQQHGSMRAVLYDTEQDRFFVLTGGGRQYLK